MLLISDHSRSSQSGFTLVEMMIVITIVGILASIATASYHAYIRKTQMMTIYQEINHFRIPYQILVNEGAGVTGFSPNGLNMPAQTENCQFTVIPPDVNAVTTDAVVCQIQNLNYLTDQTLSLDLKTDGTWHCRASDDISKSYLPQDCQ
ncbi:pilin [Psychrobacter sp. NG27]|uniref:pilin n=1 Tax=Psychrobacter sp. NG27 TaxID=2781966 RepID=UPI0018DF0FC8|nr:prepilin-type N-terminal cleavage/methylation domain-containing protein [Psychrobacter sp. NG27]MBI0426022.1 pilin [Psychrobacter sp. NG27]